MKIKRYEIWFKFTNGLSPDLKKSLFFWHNFSLRVRCSTTYLNKWENRELGASEMYVKRVDEVTEREVEEIILSWKSERRNRKNENKTI